jgi:opacity protein-like surface antigen
VLGAEISGTWLGLKNTDTYGGFDWGDLDWMAALDGRAGLLVSPQTLVYAKGGFALIDFRSDYPNYPTGPQSHELLNGFQVGGGIETRVSDRLSVRVEGVYTAALKGLEFDSSPPTQDHFFTPHVVSADIGAAIHF